MLFFVRLKVADVKVVDEQLQDEIMSVFDDGDDESSITAMGLLGRFQEPSDAAAVLNHSTGCTQ